MHNPHVPISIGFLAAICFVIQAAAAQTPVVVSASSTSSVYGQPVSLTAAITPSNASGKVTFYDGATILGIRPVSDGKASLSTSLLQTGTRSLTARYSGDTNSAPGISAVLALTVNAVPGNGFMPTLAYPLNDTSNSKAGAIEDFNGDGKADVAIIDLAKSAGWILLGHGDGTFQKPLSFAVPPQTQVMATGDFNGDSIPDLVLLGGGSHMSVLLGKGDGTFLPVLASTAYEPTTTSIVVADLNGDGKADLAVNFYGALGVYLGNGDGTFQSFLPVVGSTMPFGFPFVINKAIAVADFLVTGYLYLAYISTDRSGLLYVDSNGNTSFSPIPLPAGTPLAVAVGDLRGDGHLQIVGSAGELYIPYKFDPPPRLLGAGTGVTLADFNGDGKLDAMLYSAGNVHLFLGNGDLTFQPARIYPEGPTPNPTTAAFLAAADFNGDGIPDLATPSGVLLGVPGLSTVTTLDAVPNPSSWQGSVTVTATLSPATATGYVDFFDGAKKLGTVTIQNGTGQLTTNLLSVGDHSLTAFYAGDARYLQSTSSPLVQTVRRAAPTVAFTTTANPVTYGSAVLMTATVQPPTATGVATFWDGATVLGVRLLMKGTAVLSFILPASGNHSLSVSYGGDGNFAEGVSPSLLEVIHPGTVTTPTLALTSDSNPTILGQVTTLRAGLSAPDATGAVTFFYGTKIAGSSAVKNGQASLPIRFPDTGTIVVKAIYSGDSNYTKSVSNTILLKVQSRPVSAFAQPVSSRQDVTSIVAGDFNADGRVDLAGLTKNSVNGVVGFGVQLGNGDGTFQPAIQTFLADSISGFAMSDLNQDGIPDIVALHNHDVAVLLGNGDGSFHVSSDNLSQQAMAVAIADFDADGKADLAVVVFDGTSSNLMMFAGNGDGTFRPPVFTFTGQTSIDSMITGDFNGDGLPDIAFDAYLGYSPYSDFADAIFFGNGDGTFRPASSFGSTSFYLGTFYLGDFDGDGVNDFAVAGVWTINFRVTEYEYQAYVRLNHADGGFQVLNAPFLPYGQFAVADFDNDGKADLVVTLNSSVSLYVSNGDGTFQPPSTLATNTGKLIYTLAGDFNGDGALDLAGSDGQNIYVLLGSTLTAAP